MSILDAAVLNQLSTCNTLPDIIALVGQVSGQPAQGVPVCGTPYETKRSINHMNYRQA